MGEARASAERPFGLAVLNENKDNASSSGAYANRPRVHGCDGAAVAFQRFRICTGTPTRVMPFISCRFRSHRRAGGPSAARKREGKTKSERVPSIDGVAHALARAPAFIEHQPSTGTGARLSRSLLRDNFSRPSNSSPRRLGKFSHSENIQCNPSYFSPTFLSAPALV